jgi:putative transposase
MLCLSYEDGIQPTPRDHGATAAIDPGEIHTISAVNENGESIMITGRKMRSIHRLRNKN